MQTLPQQLEVGNNSINILNRGYALFLSLTLNFQAVLVTAGEEPNVFTLQTMITSQSIGNSGAISMTDMQIITGILDRGSNIIGRFCHILSLFSFRN